MPLVPTYTRHMVDPFDLKPADIHPADLAVHLAHIPRWGGATDPPYSVAQHCLHVCELVEPLGPVMALYGLLHDAAEAYLGDIRSPIKGCLVVAGPHGLEDFRETEARALAAIFERLGLGPEIPEPVRHADLAARATEARDLFEPPLELAGLPDPQPETIIPAANPEVVIVHWLRRLVDLLGRIGQPGQDETIEACFDELHCRLPVAPDRTPVLALVR